MSHSLEVVKAFLVDSDKSNIPQLLSHLVDLKDVGTDGYLCSLILSEDEQVNECAKNILIQRHPWLNLIPTPINTPPEQTISSKEGMVWSEIQNYFVEFIRNKSGHIDKDSPIHTIPGLHHLLISILQKNGFQQEATSFSQRVNLEQNYKRSELFFAPTYLCNISCSYCYAKGWGSKFGEYTSLADVEQLLDWMLVQKLETLSLVGGEPTIYVHLAKLLELARERGINITLASNMLYSQSVGKTLRPGQIQLVTAHYDQSYLQDSSKHSRFLSNIEKLLSDNVELRLRYTLTSASSQQEWKSVFSLLEKIGLHSLHFAPAFINYNRNNEMATRGRDPKQESSILLDFIQGAEDRVIDLHLCKPIALCFFPENIRDQLLTNGILNNVCVATDGECSRNITVNPDLSTFPCTAIGKKGPKITSFRNLFEAGAHFKSYLTGLVEKTILPECKDCFFYYTGFCQQVCLVEKHHLQEEKR